MRARTSLNSAMVSSARSLAFEFDAAAIFSRFQSGEVGDGANVVQAGECVLVRKELQSIVL